jgi:hypothetical protein
MLDSFGRLRAFLAFFGRGVAVRSTGRGPRIVLQTFHAQEKGVVMLRSFVLAASAAGLLWVFGSASVAMGSEVPGASNIGFVLYTKTYAPGTLNARWMYTSKYTGPV